MDYPDSLFPAPLSSNPLPSPQFNLQSKDGSRTQLETSRDKALNLQENITSSILPNTEAANRNTMPTCRIPLDMLHCKPIERMACRNDFSDQNVTSTFACNHEKITLPQEKSSAPPDVTEKISKKYGKMSIVWEYFKSNISKEAFICKLCECEVKNPGGTTNLWKHLRRHHAAIYNQHQ